MHLCDHLVVLQLCNITNNQGLHELYSVFPMDFGLEAIRHKQAYRMPKDNYDERKCRVSLVCMLSNICMADIHSGLVHTNVVKRENASF